MEVNCSDKFLKYKEDDIRNKMVAEDQVKWRVLVPAQSTFRLVNAWFTSDYWVISVVVMAYLLSQIVCGPVPRVVLPLGSAWFA